MNGKQESLTSYHSHLPLLTSQLVEVGSFGIMVIDASAFSVIEREYGSDTYDQVRGRVLDILHEHRGKDFRHGDVVTLDEPRGLRLLLLLERKRLGPYPISPADFKIVRARLITTVVPRLARAGFPYLKNPPRIEVAYGMALYNPLVHPESIVRRTIEEALVQASHQRLADELNQREKLQDLIIRSRIVTAFQPIVLLKDRTVLGFEALSRGARGTGFENAGDLFGTAARYALLVELDRLCRTRALLSSGRIPTNARIFINTLPATMRDPQFRGKSLITFLERTQVMPERLVIEITEKLIIENYDAFRETLAYFTDLGISFAVDDVGAGYSGLESIARLKPHYLKIDMALVRDVHSSVTSRAMVQAILAMGQDIGSTVIAEGIQTREEADTLFSMGVSIGQGFYLARPDMGPE
ncbi:MAG: EAL domain-containing protein [Vicinamibacteria bacterium]|nr:EAL domain-containing protein [Vicinamibacteria bacterium]